MKTKLNVPKTIAGPAAAPLSAVIDTGNKRDFAPSVNYGAGTSSSAKLQASNDNTNYSDVPGSTQTLDNTGGTHIWNVSNWESLYCKVVITGDAASCVILVAVPG